MSDGECRCPLSWRDRNTTGSPAISPISNGADGLPQGLLMAFALRFFQSRQIVDAGAADNAENGFGHAPPL